MAIRIYLAGAMSGLPNHGFDLFTKATTKLRKLGYTVLSPAEMSAIPEKTMTYAEHMLRDFRLVMEVDKVVVLPNWQNSKGAIHEVLLARILDKEVLDFRTLQPLDLDISVHLHDRATILHMYKKENLYKATASDYRIEKVSTLTEEFEDVKLLRNKKERSRKSVGSTKIKSKVR